MDLEQWRRSGRYLEHREHKVFWRAEGAPHRDAVLCIHGFPTASWDWHRLWPDLASRYRVLALDMLGYGFSQKPPEYRYSTFDQADLQEAFLREHQIDRVHVLAHDYGDTVAQELLARYEERRSAGSEGLEIASVCFLNGGLFPETHRIRLVQELLKSPIGFIVGRLMTEHRFGRSLASVFGRRTRPSAAELHEFWKLVQFNGGASIAHKLIRYVGERKRFRDRWVGVMQKTSVPMRLIDGADDPVSGAHMAKRYQELVPRPDVVMLKEIGHYPQLENPEAVLLAYLDFHRGLASRRATRAAAGGASGLPVPETASTPMGPQGNDLDRSPVGPEQPARVNGPRYTEAPAHGEADLESDPFRTRVAAHTEVTTTERVAEPQPTAIEERLDKPTFAIHVETGSRNGRASAGGVRWAEDEVDSALAPLREAESEPFPIPSAETAMDSSPLAPEEALHQAPASDPAEPAAIERTGHATPGMRPQAKARGLPSAASNAHQGELWPISTPKRARTREAWPDEMPTLLGGRIEGWPSEGAPKLVEHWPGDGAHPDPAGAEGRPTPDPNGSRDGEAEESTTAGDVSASSPESPA